MKKTLLFLFTFLVLVSQLNAQCTEYRVLNQFSGTTISEAKLTICGSEVLYERVQKDAQKKVDYITTYVYYENIRHYFNGATQEHVVQRILPDGTKLLSRFKSDDALEWEVVDNKPRTIAGFKCQKAVLVNQEVGNDGATIVWFAPDIPISFGPHKFGAKKAFMYGLPGLVMGISNENLRGFEILLSDGKEVVLQSLQPTWDGIEVPREMIEKSKPTKAELAKYKEAAGKK